MDPIVDRPNTRRAAAGVVLLLLLTLLAGTVAKTVIDEPRPPKNPGVPEECIPGAPHFYANDARPGSNQFGPELVDKSVEAGNARFDLKLRKDAIFAAVWEDVILYDAGKVQSHGDGWYTLRAQQFLNDEDLWCKQIGAIKDAISNTEVQDRSEKYHTFLMVPQGENIPLVRRTDRPVAMGHVLVFHLKNGRTEYARYVCDLQPARPEIPGLPPVTEAPPAQPVTPGQPETPTTGGGKDHRRSPVSDDPNDPCEACRPNGTEPSRPTQPPHNPNPEGGAGPSDSGEGATATTVAPTTSAPAATVPITASPTVPVTSP